MEEPFFTKSKETFVTCPVEAWGRMRKHLEQLYIYRNRRTHEGMDYYALSRYIRKVEKEIEYLEKTISFLFVELEPELLVHCNQSQFVGIRKYIL